jgi:hypothetical protein
MYTICMHIYIYTCVRVDGHRASKLTGISFYQSVTSSFNDSRLNATDRETVFQTSSWWLVAPC